ncbi:Lipoxygenase [Macrophomina phaseolina MS6]|uniref:Manganese lipoxygenase n=1 Tax=Macrophomina phaseolina (strain MS6) TaxID=1126212 RepID=K2R5U3_MACPH|nr:Lipoxygenase [Macrophomina phaseolina MS6]
MERLSVNPYAVRRLDPRSDALAFRIDDAVAEAVANTTLDGLLEEGRLFLVDHSYLAEYPRSQGKHSAACQAYFYLHPESGQFLPLAIKTNVGADLVYTPADAPTDWLLAKTMFNANDLFFGQMYHLANSHAVAEIVYLTAIRTLSSRHPVLALLNRRKSRTPLPVLRQPAH